MKLICKECGAEEEPAHWGNVQDMIKRSLCFTCNYWIELIGKPKAIVIDGVHHVDGGPTASPFKGFSGRKFFIKMNDGKEVTTDNLWYQGPIPEHFKSRLPDNASWIPQPKPKHSFPF